MKNACRENIGVFLNRWRSWLSQSIGTNHTIEEVSKEAVNCLLRSSHDVPAGQYIFSTQLDIQCPHGVSKEHFCDIEMLIDELEKNQMFEMVSDFLSKGQPNCNLKMFGQSSICISISGDDSTNDLETSCKKRCLHCLQPAHFISLFLLSWPYQTLPELKCETNGYILNSNVCTIVASSNAKYLGIEVRMLRKQFKVLLSAVVKCCCWKDAFDFFLLWILNEWMLY